MAPPKMPWILGLWTVCLAIGCSNVREAQDPSGVVQAAAYSGRVEEAINPLCPFSNEAIRDDSLADYGGSIVGFCNPGCRDKFVAEPALYLHHFPELEDR